MSNNLLWYLGFNLVPGIGPLRLQRLIDVCGSVAAAWYADSDQLRAAGCDSRARAGLAEARRRLDLRAELVRLQAAGVQAVCIEDAHYPQLLREVPSAPPLIYLRGSLTTADHCALAVVGTRRPGGYGRDVTAQLVAELVDAGVTIVSGLALGIDTIAHQTALARRGRTIAVLAGGVDRPYPASNLALAERICRNGALISDYPLGTTAAPLNFPPRNRIISGLSRAVLVVEAGLQSGALITVNFALDQGRDVLAVPGSIFSPVSAGPNHLIRLGAVPIRSAADVLEALDIAAPPPAVPPPAADAGADSDEAVVRRLLHGTPRSIDELTRLSGLAPQRVAAALALLELRGTVRRSGPHSFLL